jgi:RNase adaptor protein for sRNA GlmZ degradation
MVALVPILKNIYSLHQMYQLEGENSSLRYVCKQRLQPRVERGLLEIIRHIVTEMQRLSKRFITIAIACLPCIPWHAETGKILRED